MGRRMFGGGDGPWNESWEGWRGDVGDGTRLFDHLGPDQIELEVVRVVESEAVTHLNYRVVR